MSWGAPSLRRTAVGETPSCGYDGGCDQARCPAPVRGARLSPGAVSPSLLIAASQGSLLLRRGWSAEFGNGTAWRRRSPSSARPGTVEQAEDPGRGKQCPLSEMAGYRPKARPSEAPRSSFSSAPGEPVLKSFALRHPATPRGAGDEPRGSRAPRCLYAIPAACAPARAEARPVHPPFTRDTYIRLY